MNQLCHTSSMAYINSNIESKWAEKIIRLIKGLPDYYYYYYLILPSQCPIFEYTHKLIIMRTHVGNDDNYYLPVLRISHFLAMTELSPTHLWRYCIFSELKYEIVSTEEEVENYRWVLRRRAFHLINKCSDFAWSCESRGIEMDVHPLTTFCCISL